MKKRGTIAVLCALSLALVACGGKPAPASSGTDEAATTEATSTEATSSTTSSTTTETATPAPTTPVGTWKVAAVEMEGITMVGDFATVAAVFGGADDAEAAEAYNMTIELKDDGTGAMTMGSESRGITWSESGGTVTITGDSESSTAMTGTFENGVLTFNTDDESNMIIIMTQDGTYTGGKTYDVSKAAPITSENTLVGTWKLVGVNMMGVSMTGDAASMAELFGYDTSNVTFSAGGTVNVFGDDSTYTVGSDGAKIFDNVETDLAMDLLLLDDNIVIDMSSALGADMSMVLSK